MTEKVRPCVKCGETDRYTNGKCRPCNMAFAAAWRLNNLEKEKASGVAWRKANPERLKAVKDAWHLANPGKATAYTAKYRATHPDRRKASVAAWVKANEQKNKENKAAWHKENREKCNTRSQAWRRDNAERVKVTTKAWKKANPEALRIQSSTRRARKLGSGGALSKGLTEKLFNQQKGKCPCCKKSLGKDYHLDHIVPLAKGGANSDENMQLLRSICNQNKCAKDPIAFMQERGFLL